MKNKTLSLVLTAVIGLCTLTSCGSNTDEFVSKENINQSSVNVAEGFFQAVFTDDEELFEECYPLCFRDFVNDDGEKVDMEDLFEQYTAVVDPSYTYAGASLSAYNDYDEEHGYTDFPSLAQDIAALHHTDADLIEAAQIVKLRINFETDSNEHYNTDVYIIVYKMEAAWYVFELQNSDAQFAV